MSEIILIEGSSPSTPSTGKISLYSKTDSILYTKDDAGNEKSIITSGNNISKFVNVSHSEWVGTFGEPLSSTAWDGDSFSTVGRFLIDLSSVFGVPAGVKAIDTQVWVRDSASAASSSFLGVYFGATSDNTGWKSKMFQCNGVPNDYTNRFHSIIYCNADGDIYYNTVSSGTSTLDIWLYIWGYWI